MLQGPLSGSTIDHTQNVVITSLFQSITNTLTLSTATASANTIMMVTLHKERL